MAEVGDKNIQFGIQKGFMPTQQPRKVTISENVAYPTEAWKDKSTFEQWLRRYYKSIGPRAREDPEIQALIKADARYDYGETTFWDPEHSARVTLEGLVRETSLYAILPKTTFIQEGNSFRYISAEAAGSGTAVFLGDEGAMFGVDTAMPTAVEVEGLWPAVFAVQWEDTKVMTEMEKVWRTPKLTSAFIKEYFDKFYLDRIDRQLAGVQLSSTVHGVDTPATSTYATIESLDRMISDQAESGTASSGGGHVNAATDGDIFWGKTNITGTDTAIFDRSAVTTSDACIKLPSTAPTGAGTGVNEAYNILDELDDLMAEALIYAPTDQRNYIGITSPLALNKVQDELDPKMRYLEHPMEIYQTLNGVSTRPGALAGKISVPGLIICGVKVPFFTNVYLAGQDGLGWKNTVYTTAGAGNIYLVNMDTIEIRHLIPPTFQSIPNYGDWILGNRNIWFSAMTLICRNFHANAALKYIAK